MSQARLASSFAVTALTAVFAVIPAMASAQTNDAAQIRAVEQQFAKAFRAKDADGIMANYEHSPALVFFDVVPRQKYTGWNAYRKDWQNLFDSIDGAVREFEIKDLTITADGSIGYSYSFQHYRAKTKGGGMRDVTVRVTDAYQKCSGRWLIVQEHVSVPVDLRTGKADLQFKP